MTHAERILAQLREGLDDEDIRGEQRERLEQRAEELEAEIAADGDNHD